MPTQNFIVKQVSSQTAPVVRRVKRYSFFSCTCFGVEFEGKARVMSSFPCLGVCGVFVLFELVFAKSSSCGGRSLGLGMP